MEKPHLSFFEAPSSRKFWVLVYIVPWFIVGFLSAIFMSSSGSKSSIQKTDTTVVGFSWDAVPWRVNNLLKNQLVAMYPIVIHGNLMELPDQIYRGTANLSDPIYASITSSCVSNDGYVVHSDREYPANHPWFPKFSLVNFSRLPRDKTTYPRIISIPQPPGMSDQFFIANIFPLLFTVPQEIVASSVLCLTRISPALETFFRTIQITIQIITTQNGVVCAEEVIIPKIPSEFQVAQSATVMFADSLLSIIQSEEFAKAMIMRDGDPDLRRREPVTKKLLSMSKENSLMEKMWTISEQIYALANSHVAIGFGSDQLNLATFMRQNSNVIVVQKDNVVSRPALTARAMGFRVHVIPIRDGDVILDSVCDTIKSIIDIV